MFKVSRQARIKEIILDRNQVDVQTLSNLLNVSSVTIRNDLEALEAEGIIIRTHGGAILNDSYSRNHTPSNVIEESKLEYDKYKDEIGQIASHLIEENEWIFLGPGTTCCFLALHLAEKNHLNIITNNLYTLPILSKNPLNNTVVVGGNLFSEDMCLGGDFFLQTLRNIHISKAFFGVTGVDLKAGYTVANFAQLNIFQHIQRLSEEIVFLADHTKFNVVSLARIGDLKTAGTLISNECISQEYKSYFFDNGIRLFTSYDFKKSSVHGRE